MPALRLDAHGPALAFLDPGEEPRRDERLLRVHSAQEGTALLERISPAAAGRETLVSLLEPELGFATARMGDWELRAAAAARMADGRLRAVELPATGTMAAAGQSFRVVGGSERPRRGESPVGFFDREGVSRFLARIEDDPWGRPALHEAARRSTGRGRGEPVREVLERFAEQIATRRVQIVRIGPAGGARLPRATLPPPVQPRVARATEPCFQLCEIPEVMERVYGWTVAPRLMRGWFQRPLYQMREVVKTGEVDPAKLAPGVVDTSTVRMSWVGGFPLARQARDNFRRGSWNTERGRARLAAQVARAQREQGICSLTWRFGDLRAPTPVVDSKFQVNIALLDTGVRDEIDEWYAAMGDALLKVAVSGQVTHGERGRASIVVDEIGVYVRDTYDFNDGRVFSQPLGTWSRAGVRKQPSAERIATDQLYGGARGRLTQTAGAWYDVWNGSFADYREHHRRGGDFVIFSDVERYRPPRPLVLELDLPAP